MSLTVWYRTLREKSSRLRGNWKGGIDRWYPIISADWDTEENLKRVTAVVDWGAVHGKGIVMSDRSG